LNFREICVPFFIVFLLFPFVHAQSGNDQAPLIDFSGVINAINGMFSGVSKSLSDLPSNVLNSFTGFFRGELISFLNPLLSLAKLFITSNPDPNLMLGLWKTIVLIISFFYLLLFLVVGFMFLFSSFDSSRRLKAKEWLKGGILIVIGVNASFLLYSLFLSLSAGIAGFLWANELDPLFTPSALSALNLILLGVYSFNVMLAFITFFIRYLVLLIGVVLFPIAIFFYFIPPLKAWGKLFFEILFAMALMQVIDVIVFIGASMVWKQFISIPDIIGIAPAMAFILIAVINAFIIVFAALRAGRMMTKEFPEVMYAVKAGATSAVGALV